MKLTEILLPTAYLPPIGYFRLIAGAEKIMIENEENYIKQTFRNRCTILSVNGTLNLVVPVRKGTSLKTALKDAMIDYSKRWQQTHIRAISAAYGKSPFFQFYSEHFEKIILKNYKYLIDLNNSMLNECLSIINLKRDISYTSFFTIPGKAENDFRYTAMPDLISDFKPKQYIQVFSSEKPVPGLSIIDLIFNTGPDTSGFL
jgi:hypothetical protein